jgi:hypothetical protein
MSSDNEILALEDKRYAAMCSGDFGALEAMLHDELLYTHSSGLTDTKATWLASLKHAVARVQHRQWKLEKRSPDYVPKSVSVTKNIYQDVRDADTPEEAMKRYAAILDLRPDE